MIIRINYHILMDFNYFYLFVVLNFLHVFGKVFRYHLLFFFIICRDAVSQTIWIRSMVLDTKSLNYI